MLILLFILPVTALPFLSNPLHWGAQYSPFYPVEEYQPPSCRISQVSILQRHGARTPTMEHAQRMRATVARFQALERLPAQLEFIRNWSWERSDIGGDDEIPDTWATLTEYGKKEIQESGRVAWKRYQSGSAFIRCSSSRRTKDSAALFLQELQTGNGELEVPPTLVLRRTSLNNTLHNLCPRVSGLNDTHAAEYLESVALAFFTKWNLQEEYGQRLLLDVDVVNFGHLCSFESLGRVDNLPSPTSPFCSLFDAFEWEQLEHYNDLNKYYSVGPGSFFARSQAVGYANELLARLTNSDVFREGDETQVNRTAPFPLDKHLYADFSHDNFMMPLYSLIGVPSLPPALPSRQSVLSFIQRVFQSGIHWRVSELTPFAGRVIFERLECSDGTKVRMLINDREMDLSNICTFNRGACLLDEFVEHMKTRITIGTSEWKKFCI